MSRSQLAFDFSPPPLATPIAEKLITSGLVPNDFILTLNGGLTNPDDVPAPSRAYQFPIGYQMPGEDEPEAIYVRHPALADLPFVQHVKSIVGPFEACHDDRIEWWHAIDLMNDQHHEHLMATQHLTDRQCLLNAVNLAVQWGRLKHSNARTILNTLGVPEPENRSRGMLLGDGLWPARIPPEGNGKPYWAPNVRSFDAAAWMVIHGIEDGYLSLKKGHLTVADKCIAARGER